MSELQARLCHGRPGHARARAGRPWHEAGHIEGRH